MFLNQSLDFIDLVDGYVEEAMFECLIKGNIKIPWERNFSKLVKRQLLQVLLLEKMKGPYSKEALRFYYINSVIDKLYDLEAGETEVYFELVKTVKEQVSMIFAYVTDSTIDTGQWSEPITPGWISPDVTFGIRLLEVRK